MAAVTVSRLPRARRSEAQSLCGPTLFSRRRRDLRRPDRLRAPADAPLARRRERVRVALRGAAARRRRPDGREPRDAWVGEHVRAREDSYDVPVFAAPPAFLEALGRAGVDVVTVANNHAYDQGVTGLAETLAQARSAGVATVGAGTDRAHAYAPLVREVHGLRIAIVAATEGVNLAARAGEPSSPRVASFDEAALARAVEDARAGSALTVVALHFTEAGYESALPTDEIRLVRPRGGGRRGSRRRARPPRARPRADAADERRARRRRADLARKPRGRDARRPRRAGRSGLSVRDAVLARVRTRRAPSGRLEVSAVEARPFYIDVSSRAVSGEDALRATALDRRRDRARDRRRLWPRLRRASPRAGGPTRSDRDALRRDGRAAARRGRAGALLGSRGERGRGEGPLPTGWISASSSRRPARAGATTAAPRGRSPRASGRPSATRHGRRIRARRVSGARRAAPRPRPRLRARALAGRASISTVGDVDDDARVEIFVAPDERARTATEP